MPLIKTEYENGKCFISGHPQDQKGKLELNNWQNKWKDADSMAQDLSHELQSLKA